MLSATKSLYSAIDGYYTREPDYSAEKHNNNSEISTSPYMHISSFGFVNSTLTFVTRYLFSIIFFYKIVHSRHLLGESLPTCNCKFYTF